MHEILCLYICVYIFVCVYINLMKFNIISWFTYYSAFSLSLYKLESKDTKSNMRSDVLLLHLSLQEDN